MPTYNIGLNLANPSPSRFLCDEAFKNTIHNAVDEYNSICSTAKNNPKKIEILEIGERHIIISLFSKVELPTPGKALRSLSQILLRDRLFQDTFIFGKQLFTSFDVTNSHSILAPKKHISADDIDDALFLSSLVNYFFNKRDSDTKTYIKKRKAIEKMKILAYESDIIKLNDSNNQ